MISHIFFEFLAMGQIPVYEVGDATHFWHLDPPHWNYHFVRHRITNFDNLDLPIEGFLENVPNWVRNLPQDEGSLLFTVRYNGLIGPSQFLCCGLSFVPCGFGVPLTEDPVVALRELGRAHTRELVERLPPNIRAIREGRGAYTPSLWYAAQREHEDRNNQRARILLYEHLSEEQIADLEELGHFTVLGMDGHRYRIEDKPIHNVFRLEQDRPVIEYCIVVKGQPPRCDQLLSQKLLLEADIETFMAYSNKWSLTENRRYTPARRLG